MKEQLHKKILSHLESGCYRPVGEHKLAAQLQIDKGRDFGAFRDALKELMREGRVMLGAGGNVVLPVSRQSQDVLLGTYRQNKRGFGFVMPADPEAHEDLFIPEGEHGGAITGDTVRAKITNREQRDGKVMYRGRITEIVTRTQKRFVGSLVKQGGQWVVLP